MKLRTLALVGALFASSAVWAADAAVDNLISSRCATCHGAGGGDLLGRRRIGVQAALGEPDAADIHRFRRRHIAVGVAADHLGGTATQIDDDEWPVTGGQFGDRAVKRQGGLLVAADHLGHRPGCHGPEHLGRHGEELVAVGGIPGGRGGDHPDPRNIVRGQGFRVANQCVPGPLQCGVAEPSGGVHPFAEAHDAHLLVHGAHNAGGIARRDEQEDRVRSEIEGGDVHGARWRKSKRKRRRADAPPRASLARSNLGHLVPPRRQHPRVGDRREPVVAEGVAIVHFDEEGSPVVGDAPVEGVGVLRSGIAPGGDKDVEAVFAHRLDGALDDVTVRRDQSPRYLRQSRTSPWRMKLRYSATK